MRLIDADQMALDESEAYMSAQTQISDDLTWLVNFGAHNKLQRMIADTPTVDAVPVVRCKDCKYCDISLVLPTGREMYTCMEGSHDHQMLLNPNDFCSRGKGKEEDNNG